MSLALFPRVVERHSFSHVELIAVSGEGSQLDVSRGSDRGTAVVGEF